MRLRRSLLFGLMPAVQFSLAEPLPEKISGRLASDNFVEREAAQKELLGWARKNREARAVALLGLLSHEDPEIRKRSHEILRDLSDEDYLSDGQGYLGIVMGEEMLQDGFEGKAGVGIRISRVLKDSPADLAGLRAGDLITALNGKSWEKAGALHDFTNEIARIKPLEDVVLTMRKEGADSFEVTVKLGKRPVADLQLARENLQELDRKAREKHFMQWLDRLQTDPR